MAHAPTFSPQLARIAARLEKLALRPPQVLLLEGGLEDERLNLALFWAKSLACPQAIAKLQTGQPASPCLSCQVCQQIQANESLDLLMYDGRISNRMDEEKPGAIRALRMENMRELKSLVATAPHGQGKRMAIIQGMSQSREEALNSLLKILEEPSSTTNFTLLTPQRQQILPTLVSRSFCLTLPWPGCQTLSGQTHPLLPELAHFLKHGAGFLDKISAKGFLEPAGAAQLIIAMKAALTRSSAGLPGINSLDNVFKPISRNASAVLTCSAWLGEAEEMLNAAVAPARALEGLCTRLFLLLHSQKLE